MHVHILGIGGTFMAGVAVLAQAAGHRVTGADTGIYPPMSHQLAAAGIAVIKGYDLAQLSPPPDQVVIGNALSRGNPAVEAVLDSGLAYISGPQWLAENVLRGRWVLAVAGTHGKTTTASMLAYILAVAGAAPGYLIGGLAHDLGVSAALGRGDLFVVEADEYDTAFFDKRSKFVHYRPRTLVLNNLEFDHADIFDDLEAIRRQFHYLLRTVPGNGLIVHNAADPEIAAVLGRGVWTPTKAFNHRQGWWANALTADASRLAIWRADRLIGELDWTLTGHHNAVNALAALAAACHAGVAPEIGVQALARFRGVKRRLELRGVVNGIRVFDDFAHHPSAIRATLAGLRASDPKARLLAVFEPRSNTMRAGVHAATLAAAFADADYIFVYDAGLAWDIAAIFAGWGDRYTQAGEIETLVAAIAATASPGDLVVAMSNASFDGIHDKLLARL